MSEFSESKAEDFGLRLIIKFEVFLHFTIQEPKLLHFHSAGALLFGGVVDDANCVSVINMYRHCGWGCPSSARVRRRTLAWWVCFVGIQEKGT